MTSDQQFKFSNNGSLTSHFVNDEGSYNKFGRFCVGENCPYIKHLVTCIDSSVSCNFQSFTYPTIVSPDVANWQVSVAASTNVCLLNKSKNHHLFSVHHVYG